PATPVSGQVDDGGRKQRTRTVPPVDRCNRRLLVLHAEHPGGPGESPERLLVQLPLLDLRRRPDQRQRRPDGDRHPDRRGEVLHEPPRLGFSTDPGHGRLRPPSVTPRREGRAPPLRHPGPPRLLYPPPRRP